MSVFNSSWLTTARRRAKEGILQAVGAHQATEDVEFDTKLRNFSTHVGELNKIKEAMDLWIESFDTFCSASLILNDSFKTFFSQSPYPPSDEDMNSYRSPYMNASLAFDKIMVDMNQIIQPSVRETFVNRCLKPTISILSLVPAISELVQERRTCMLDFDSYKAKIQKEHSAGRDSAHPNVAKKALKLDDSAKKLYTIQQSIVRSIGEFEAARPIMLGAEFTAFVACFYHQAYHSSDLAARLLPMVPQCASSLSLMDSFVQQKQCTAIGEDFLPCSSFPSAQFIADIQRLPPGGYAPVEPVVTRSEYLGGGYGGYSTGGPLLGRAGAEGEVDEEELRAASAHLVSSALAQQHGASSSAATFASTDSASATEPVPATVTVCSGGGDSPLADAVVLPAVESSGGSSERDDNGGYSSDDEYSSCRTVFLVTAGEGGEDEPSAETAVAALDESDQTGREKEAEEAEEEAESAVCSVQPIRPRTMPAALSPISPAAPPSVGRPLSDSVHVMMMGSSSFTAQSPPPKPPKAASKLHGTSTGSMAATAEGAAVPVVEPVAPSMDSAEFAAVTALSASSEDADDSPPSPV